MPTESEFRTLTAQAYEHLYDLVYLRCHSLVDLLIPEPTLDHKERAWKLHALLLRALDDLNPGPNAPAHSLEARRHQLMVLHYVDGLDPQAIADRLGISRRHFYREHEAGLDAVSIVLWQQYHEALAALSATDAPQPPTERAELLRQEAERLAQTDHFSRIHEVLPGALSLLGGRLCQRNLTVEVATPPSTPPLSTDRNLLRQILLAALSLLVERSTDAKLILTTASDETHVHVRLRIAPWHPPAAIDPPPFASLREQEMPTPREPALASVHELVSLAGAEVTALAEQGGIDGLELHLPRVPEHRILVVDDNRDTLEFFRRVLPYHGYHVITAATGAEALHLARSVRPDIIVLDVMMPEQDGWEVLQILRNQPETQDAPVVICSVLRAAELAISIGANAFLAKPLTEEALLAALRAQL